MEDLRLTPAVTWAQLHQVREFLWGKGAMQGAVSATLNLVLHLPPLPALVVRRPLLQLKHQRS